MKVVHVITSTNLGGAQVMLSRYLGALGAAARDHSVISLMPPGPIARDLRSAGIGVTDLGLSAGAMPLRALRQLRQRLAAAAPDVVYGWMHHGCLAALAGRAGLRDAALVWGIHHSLADIRAEKPATRAVLRTLAALSGRADAIAYCSEAARAQHQRIGFGASRATVIPNAVDAGAFRPDPAARGRLEALCGIPEGRRIVGTVARAHPMKDHVAMIRAVAALVAEGRDVHAVLVGEGQPEGPARAEADRLGLAGRVSLLGARDDVAALLPGFDVYLLSSAWGEAFPVSVCEAMAAGVPCVVTDVGDSARLVGPTGSVVPPRDPGAMAAALATWLDLGPEARAAAGRAARDRVATRFSFERYVDAHEALYIDATRRRRGLRPPGASVRAA